MLDETSLPQIESDEIVSDKILSEDLSPPVLRKPNKMADRKRKLVDGAPIEKVEEMRSPMDMAPSADLFQQLMVPISDNVSNEMERLYNMRYEKFDENPRGESPK